MHKRALLTVVLAVASATAGTAAAQDQETPQEQAVFLHCPSGAARQTNVASGPIAWDSQRPTATLAQGGGCTYADPGTPGAVGPGFDVDSFSARGMQQGLLDTLTLSIDDRAAGTGLETRTVFELNVVVDGRQVVRGVQVGLVPELTSTGGRYTVTVTGIGLTRPQIDNGSRQIAVSLDRLSNTPSAYMFDSAETPGGITFNARAPRGATVAAG